MPSKRASSQQPVKVRQCSPATHGQGVALEFHGMDSGADIQDVVVTGGSPGSRMPASGGVMLLQEGWRPSAHRTVHLGYRLILGPSALVGT